jgi:hypothetical protein
MESVTGADNTEPAALDERRQRPDRRTSPRRKVLRGGKTFWPNGDSADCTVYNFSETGAKLELSGHGPNAFDLVVDGDPLRRSCLVVWRKAKFVGVKFQNPSQLLVSPIGNATRTTADFAKYVEECQRLAQRATPSDSKILLEMAEAWKIAVRRLRKKARNVSI